MELVVTKEFGFLAGFAELIGSEVRNGLLKIPENKGNGYLRGFRLDNSISMIVSNYELKEDLLTRRTGTLSSLNRILFTFNSIFPDTNTKVKSTISDLPSIQVFKGKLNIDTFYPNKTKFKSIVISVDSKMLATFLGSHAENDVFKRIISSEQTVLFEEFVSPKIQEVALEIVDSDIPDTLSDFFFKIKAEELICLTLKELFKREGPTMHVLNEIDAQRIYEARDAILKEIHVPPVIKKLAAQSGMSESKFKRLFKQIFGDSFFSYYQKFRMKEAARLLKENKMSVSEVGYALGFSNLSHFTKVFEEHNGIKPKAFQRNY